VKWPVAVWVASAVVDHDGAVVAGDGHARGAGSGSVATPSRVICRSMVVLVFCWTRWVIADGVDVERRRPKLGRAVVEQQEEAHGRGSFVREASVAGVMEAVFPVGMVAAFGRTIRA
jgi:hypothetical protein